MTAHDAPLTLERLSRRLACARGDAPGDLLFRGGRVINTASGEIHPADVLIVDGVIAGVGDYRDADEVIDATGLHLAPGFLDGHVHVESSMLTPRRFAEAVISRGTTTVIADPHEIANVLGTAGLDYMLEAAAGAACDLFFMLPSCVPATDMETSGARLEAEDLAPYFAHPRVLGLGEFMNFPAVTGGDPAALAKILAARGAVIDGHAPGVTGRLLNAYALLGISSDHECVTTQEAIEKLRLGMKIMVREGSATKNLEPLLPFVNQFNDRACFFATDDRHVDDLVDDGHIDAMVRRTVEVTGNVVRAVRMATLNGYEHFGLHDRGMIVPGRRADLVAFSGLGKFEIRHVVKDGRVRLRDGVLLPDHAPHRAAPPRDTMRIAGFSRDRLRIAHDAASPARVRVIGVVPDQIVTLHEIAEVAPAGGELRADPARDLLKIAVVERHRGTGNVGLGFVRGLGLRGAIATTVAHDSHNLVVAGSDDALMAEAVERVRAMGGGLCLLSEAAEAELPLPVAGLMSDRPVEELYLAMRTLREAAAAAGSPLHDPFMTLAFLALPVIPSLKLTDRGLVDVERFAPVGLLAE